MSDLSNDLRDMLGEIIEKGGETPELPEDRAPLVGKVEEARETLESIRDEEQEKFDNMPEGLQGATSGVALQDAIESIEGVISSLESAQESLSDALLPFEDFEADVDSIIGDIDAI